MDNPDSFASLVDKQLETEKVKAKSLEETRQFQHDEYEANRNISMTLEAMRNSRYKAVRVCAYIVGGLLSISMFLSSWIGHPSTNNVQVLRGNSVIEQTQVTQDSISFFMSDNSVISVPKESVYFQID